MKYTNGQILFKVFDCFAAVQDNYGEAMVPKEPIFSKEPIATCNDEKIYIILSKYGLALSVKDFDLDYVETAEDLIHNNDFDKDDIVEVKDEVTMEFPNENESCPFDFVHNWRSVIMDFMLDSLRNNFEFKQYIIKNIMTLVFRKLYY